MRSVVFWIFAAALSAFGRPAFAQDPAAPPEHGLEIGIRLGFSLPGGNEGKTPGGSFGDLTYDLSGMVPLSVDGGYRFTRNLYLGLSFQYAFGLFSTDYCSEATASCSARDALVGLTLEYHVLPQQSIDPWVGVGVGYEWLMLNGVTGSQPDDRSASGFELAALQLGGDFPMAPNLSIGPFLSVSFGQFRKLSVTGPGYSYDMDVIDKEIHEWVTFGVRGICDVLM